MRCYRCNGELDVKKDSCSKCGANTALYKKIVYASNKHYNRALLKAQSRDLTGAIQELTDALHLYKKNVPARNLLGLCYYAIGEASEALKHWVISKNDMPENNPADRYINAIKRSMSDLNSESNGIKKYNQALAYAKNNAKDLAVIQLKKVISILPQMTKAYELLGLLYLNDGKTEQAKNVFRRALSVDRGNVNALRYLKECKEAENPQKEQPVGVVGDEAQEELIIPVRFRDYGSYLSNALYIGLGLLLGILIAVFVIVPGRVDKEIGDADTAMRSYEEEISDLREQLAAYEKSSEEESTEETPTESASESEEDRIHVLPTAPDVYAGWTANQDAITKCVNDFNSGRHAEFFATFVHIDLSSLSDTNQMHARNLIAQLFDSRIWTVTVEQANLALNNGNNQKAAEYYEALAYLFPDSAGFRLCLGIALENYGDLEGAMRAYYQTAVLFPGTTEGNQAAEGYKRLTKETFVPDVPEGTDIESYKVRPTVEELLAKIGGTN